MIYLDNAATTLKKPPEVTEAIIHSLATMGNSGRGVHESSLDSSRIIFQTRYKLAQLFNAPNPKQIVFTSNATDSLNIVIQGLIKSDDHVITTSMEHNSVLRPLFHLEEKGTELTIIPTDLNGVIDYNDLIEAIQPNTKAIVITHASNLTGNLIDLKKVSEITQKHNLLLIVDASQTAGVIPIDVIALQIDALCFTGHKSLFGPQGTGGLYLKENLEITPLKFGGTGSDTYNKKQPETMPTKLEAGTLNGHGIAGLSAALDYLEEKGIATIFQEEQALMIYFYEKVRQMEGVTIYGDFSTYNRCPIVSLNLLDIDSSEISDQLYTDFNIATRAGGHCAPLMHESLETTNQGVIRFSFSHYNTIKEVQYAVDALKTLLSQNRRTI